MSKLRRQIRNLGRPAAGSIGFAHGPAAGPARQVLLIADVETAEAAAAALAAGADALLLPPQLVAAAAKAAGERPVGARLESATADAIAAAARDGADFFLFDDALTPASALLRGGENDPRGALGRVLRLGEDRSEERLRSIAALNLDAMLIDGVGTALTVREQLGLRRTIELAAVPLLVGGTAVPSTETFEVWRDAGAPLVLLRGDPAVIQASAEAARAVPAPRRSREDRPALVPAMTGHYQDDDEEPL